MNWKKPLDKIRRTLNPVKDVLLFLLISAMVIEGWRQLGLDVILSPLIRQLFHGLMAVEFAISARILELFLPLQIDRETFLITFSNQQSVFLYEGCSGLKQVFQFTLILMIYPGSWKKKAWFIPLSSLLLIIAAIVHFIFLCLILYKFPFNYEFMHDHISRWFFFLIFFLLWVLFSRNSTFSGNTRSKSQIDPR